VIRRLEQRRFPVKDVVSQLISVEEAPEALRSWSDEPSRGQEDHGLPGPKLVGPALL
jgi:hypothetical protein